MKVSTGHCFFIDSVYEITWITRDGHIVHKQEVMCPAPDYSIDAAREIASHWTFGGGRDSYVTPEQRENIAQNFAVIIRKYYEAKDK